MFRDTAAEAAISHAKTTSGLMMMRKEMMTTMTHQVRVLISNTEEYDEGIALNAFRQEVDQENERGGLYKCELIKNNSCATNLFCYQK